MRGERGLGWSAGRVRVRSVRVRGGSGQNFSNSCGCRGVGVKFSSAGRERTQNFNPRRTLVCTELPVAKRLSNVLDILLLWKLCINSGVDQGGERLRPSLP